MLYQHKCILNSGESMFKSARHRFLFLLLVLLPACSDRSSPDYFLNEYLSRLSRVTEIKLSPSKPTAPTLPTLRQRTYTVPDIRLKALEALDLLKCPALSQTVAYRNSSLGKQMLPSQHYFHEKKLLLQIPQCLHDLRKDPKNKDIIQRLEDVLQEKQAAFAPMEWNLIFANTEISRQLTSQGRLLPADGASGFQGTREALSYLTKMLPDRTLTGTYDSHHLERHLQQVSASRYLGKLFYTEAVLTQTLNDASNLLEQRLQKGPVCTRANPDEGKRLHNVFRLFYRDKIQPYLTGVYQQGTSIRQSFLLMLQQLPEPPNPTMAKYLARITDEQREDGLWYPFRHSIQRHARVWQQLLKQCGISVG